jgi:hypothetical protein
MKTCIIGGGGGGGGLGGGGLFRGSEKTQKSEPQQFLPYFDCFVLRDKIFRFKSWL